MSASGGIEASKSQAPWAGNHEDRHQFSKWLRDRLEYRELTQADFARQARVRSGTVSKWYNGRTVPRPHYATVIAKVLQVHPQDVLDRRAYKARATKPEDGDIHPELRKFLDAFPFLDALSQDTILIQLNAITDNVHKKHPRLSSAA